MGPTAPSPTSRPRHTDLPPRLRAVLHRGLTFPVSHAFSGGSRYTSFWYGIFQNPLSYPGCPPTPTLAVVGPPSPRSGPGLHRSMVGSTLRRTTLNQRTSTTPSPWDTPSVLVVGSAATETRPPSCPQDWRDGDRGLQSRGQDTSPRLVLSRHTEYPNTSPADSPSRTDPDLLVLPITLVIWTPPLVPDTVGRLLLLSSPFPPSSTTTTHSGVTRTCLVDWK